MQQLPHFQLHCPGDYRGRGEDKHINNELDIESYNFTCQNEALCYHLVQWAWKCGVGLGTE